MFPLGAVFILLYFRGLTPNDDVQGSNACHSEMLQGFDLDTQLLGRNSSVFGENRERLRAVAMMRGNSILVQSQSSRRESFAAKDSRG